MKVHVTWADNGDSTQRILFLHQGIRTLWVALRGTDGEPLRDDHVLEVSTRYARGPLTSIRWLYRRGVVAADWRQLPMSSKLTCTYTVDRGLFAPVHTNGCGSQRHWLPYYFDIAVKQQGDDREVTSLYVVPYPNRLLTMAFAGIGLVVATYLSWLLLNLRWQITDGAFDKYVTLLALSNPVAGLLAPFFFTRVRRKLLDSSWTGVILLAFSVAVVGVHQVARPVSIRNLTPQPLDLSNAGCPLLIPAASAQLVSSRYCPSKLDELECLAGGGSCDGPLAAYVNAGICLHRDERGACRDFYPVDWSMRLQSWFGGGPTMNFGCRDGLLDPECQAEWLRSASCRIDPGLTSQRSLDQYLSVKDRAAAEGRSTSALGSQSQQAERASWSNGEVVVRCAASRRAVPPPPAHSSRPAEHQTEVTALRPTTLRPLAVHWPRSAGCASLPTWSFSSEGEVSQVRLAPTTSGAGSTDTRYCYTRGGACNHEGSASCSELLVPTGPIDATITQGKASVGALACEGAQLVVMSGFVDDGVSGVRLVHGSESLAPFEVFRSSYVPSSERPHRSFWCEPRVEAALSTNRLELEMQLANDWQPDEGWSFERPASSRISTYRLRVQGKGLWGRVTCIDEPVISLIRSRSAASSSIMRAADAEGEWRRNPDAALYPSWMFVCGRWGSDRKLDVALADGRHGELRGNGELTISRGAACLIDRRGWKIGVLNGPSMTLAGATILERFPIDGCDPARSQYGEVPRVASMVQRGASR